MRDPLVSEFRCGAELFGRTVFKVAVQDSMGDWGIPWVTLFDDNLDIIWNGPEWITVNELVGRSS